MNLQRFLNEERLRPHKTSPKEIADLFRIIERDLKDSRIKQLSVDRRFATAYNAALQLATVILYASGYRPTGIGHHWVTFEVLPELMGEESQAAGDYFNICRSKRNLTDYDRAGEISETEMAELIKEVELFRIKVIEWIKEKFPELLP
ncbi:MAG: hypothetical protein M1269_13680 [Chloroflexi bacterium]|nr:hypothetical protein [Chloroflexota bacterium]